MFFGIQSNSISFRPNFVSALQIYETVFMLVIIFSFVLKFNKITELLNMPSPSRKERTWQQQKSGKCNSFWVNHLHVNGINPLMQLFFFQQNIFKTTKWKKIYSAILRVNDL